MLRKLHLFLIVTLCTLTGFAQTIVSTSPQNKNVVLEEFTGVNCVWCPDGHARAQAIQDANPNRVALINIHAGSFAIPNGNQPDFRTNWGNAIMNQTGLTGFPSGTVNRHVFSGNNTILDRGQWAGAANEILATPSYLNVGVEASIDLDTRELIVHAEVYYTGDSPEDENFLNVFLLQNNTRGPQTGGNMGNNYNHMHRLVDVLTGQWGDTIANTTQSSFIERTYTYSIPASYRNIEAVLRDMEIVAFVTETRQEIISGQRAFPMYLNVPIANDAKVKEIKPIDPTCHDNITPVVVVTNEGGNTITSLDIEYILNGETYTHNWTGNLTTYQDAIIELPQINTTILENNTLTINLPDDEDNSNNSESITFEKAPVGTGDATVIIRTDNWGYEFRWELRDSDGAIVQRGSGYPSNQTTEVSLSLEEDCYTFIIFDSYGDGGTRVEIKDSNDQRLFYAVGNWGERREGEFGSNGSLSVGSNEFESISIFPNPTNDILNITRAENANIAIYDILGKEILTKENISAVEGIEVSHLQAGTYFLKIARNGETTTKKFIKN